MAYPSGRRLIDPAPSPRAMGSAPITVATEVMRMGRRRIRPASSAASIVAMPRSLSWLMYSTSRIEFLVTSPISRIMPIWLYTLSVEPAEIQGEAAPR